MVRRSGSDSARGIFELTVSTTDLSTAGEKTREFVQSKILELLPYTLHMTYENWSYCTLSLPPFSPAAYNTS